MDNFCSCPQTGAIKTVRQQSTATQPQQVLDRRHAPETNPEPQPRRPGAPHVQHGALGGEVSQEVERGEIIRQQDVARAPELHVVDQPGRPRAHRQTPKRAETASAAGSAIALPTPDEKR
jgi:hypothetical protein